MTSPRDIQRFAGAVLAGGEARRLGGMAKGTIESDGVSLVARLIDELRQAGVMDVLLVANDPRPYRKVGVEIVSDLHPGIGPLGGIEAALTALADRADATVIAPCDMPCLRAREMTALMAAFGATDAPGVCARTGGFFWHPLCAVVHNDLAAKVSQAIDAGRHAVHEVWQSLGVRPVDFDDENPFTNINTPGDLAALQAGQQETAP